MIPQSVSRIEAALAQLQRGPDDVKQAAARVLAADLPGLRAVLFDRTKYATLGESQAHLLGEAAVPTLVAWLLEAPGAGDKLYGWLASGLRKMAGIAPSLMLPHQASFQQLVEALSAAAYTFYGHYADNVGFCLGVCGEPAADFIAEALRRHAAELPPKPYHEQISLRLRALVQAAEVCASEKAEQALLSLLDNCHGSGPAFHALYERRYRGLLTLVDRVIAQDHLAAVLTVLRRMLCDPAAEIADLVLGKKAELAALVRREGLYPEIRSTALLVFSRFCPRDEVLSLCVEQALSTDDKLREGAVLAAFSVDGLPVVRVKEGGGYTLFPGDGRMMSASASLPVVGQTVADVQMFAAPGNSGLNEQHVAIARSVLGYGPSRSATALLGLLGIGVHLKETDVLRADFLTRENAVDKVQYGPIALLGTSAEVLDKIATVIEAFLRTAQWPRADSLYTDAQGGVVYGVGVLVRLRKAEMLRALLTCSETLRTIVLSRSTALCLELADIYAAALKDGARDVLWNLAAALPNPDAAALILRFGLDAFRRAMKEANVLMGHGDILEAISRRDPVLGEQLLATVLSGGECAEIGEGYDMELLSHCLESRRVHKSGVKK